MAWRCRFLTARRSQHGSAPDALVDFHTDLRVRAVAAQIDEQDFVVWLPFHELPRGGHPVASLSHNAVQAHHDAGLGEGGLAFQSAARDPLVREDGHRSGVVLSESAAWSPQITRSAAKDG